MRLTLEERNSIILSSVSMRCDEPISILLVDHQDNIIAHYIFLLALSSDDLVLLRDLLLGFA